MTDKLISKEPLFKHWIKLKKGADNKEAYAIYKWFLREVQKEFTKLYANIKTKEGKKLVESILKTASWQIKEINIKYKESKLHQSMKKKPIAAMSDSELVTSWKTGKAWLAKNMKEKYPDQQSLALFLAGLERIQHIEAQLQKRGVSYG